MPDLQFKVEPHERLASSGSPAIFLRLNIENACADEVVHSIALTVQLQIEPARRRYSDAEKQALADLFGEPARWGTTVRPLFWTIINATVTGFTGITEVDLHVPCDFESDVAAAKYFRTLETGEVPVTLLFSGRVLYEDRGSLQMCPIPWSQESSCRIPVQLYKEAIAARLGSTGNHRGTAWS